MAVRAQAPSRRPPTARWSCGRVVGAHALPDLTYQALLNFSRTPTCNIFICYLIPRYSKIIFQIKYTFNSYIFIMPTPKFNTSLFIAVKQCYCAHYKTNVMYIKWSMKLRSKQITYIITFIPCTMWVIYH